MASVDAHVTTSQTAQQIRELEQRTERIYTYLPHDAFLVKMPAAQQRRAGEPALEASWVGPYHREAR